MGQLDGQVAVVTGSSQGIGAGIARCFALEGANVVVNSRSSGAGEIFAASLPSATFVPGDVADDGFAAHLVERALSTFGRLDIVVNNAAFIAPPESADLSGFTDQLWMSTLTTNVIAPFALVAAAESALREHGDGCVINTTSLLSRRTFSPLIAYNVSKAALEHLTRMLAVKLGPEIRVNAVAPGLIDTEGTTDPANDRTAPVRAAVREYAPSRRTGVPDDIARAALGLVLSPYTTGEVLHADGGLNLVM